MDNMTPFDSKSKARLAIKTIDTVRKFLRYALVDIDFKYSNLTEEEKSFCSEQEFDNMVKSFRLQ
jgi:GH18 family chitinase